MATRLQLTTNFKIEEFDCHDGTKVPSSLFANVNALAHNLQVLRDHLNKPIKILSGYRSEAYNKKCGGASRSQHLQAKAADIKVEGFTPEQLKGIIEELQREHFMKQGGIGLYDDFLHYDIRGNAARWDYRSK